MNFLTDVTGVVGILDTYKRMIEQYNDVSKLNIEHKEEILQEKLSQNDTTMNALAGVVTSRSAPGSFVSKENIGGSGLAKKTQNRRIHKFGGRKTLNKFVKKKEKKRNKKKKKQTNKK